MGHTYDCQTCGACCVEAGAVPVQPEETRVPRRWTRSVRGRMGFASWEADDSIRMMAQHIGGRCKALEGEVCASVRCRIYDRRPEACRAFPPGSPGCLDARAVAADKLKRMEWQPRGYGPNWREAVSPLPHSTTAQEA